MIYWIYPYVKYNYINLYWVVVNVTDQELEEWEEVIF